VWTAGIVGMDGGMVRLGGHRGHGGHGGGGDIMHTPEQASTTYRLQGCVPACQLGLATTPKLTAGHMMSLAVRNESMASLYALRGQVSWSCGKRDVD